MTKRYFQKLMLSTPVVLANGGKINWENAGWNTGALATEDAALADELALLKGKGGVDEVDKAAYDALKKNSVTPSPRLVWQPKVTGMQELTKPQSAKSTSPAVATEPAKPAKAEKPEQPATAKGVFSDKTE